MNDGDGRHGEGTAQRYEAGFCPSPRLLHAGEHLGAHVVHEALHLAIHLFHAFPHLQNDGDAGDVDAEVAGEVEDELEAFEVLIGIDAGIAFAA